MPSVKIKTFQGEEKVISDIELSITVLDFKEKVEEQLDLKATSQRVIFGGRVLKDDVTLEGSGIKDGDVVHVVAIVRREAPPPAEQPAASAPVNLFGDAPSAQGGQGGSGGQQGGGQQQQIADLLRTPQGQQLLMQIMNDPNALNDPMVRALLNTPDVRRMLQDPAALAQLLGGAMPSAQQPWPIIPRDVFDVAMDVLNGAPMPERYAQYGESLRREARTSRRAPATGGGGGVGMQHEFVTRVQVNAALDAALGVVAGNGDGAHAAVQPTEQAQPMDTTGSTGTSSGTGTTPSTAEQPAEQESQTTEQTDRMDTTADTSAAPTPAVGASSDSMDTGGGGGGTDASGGGDQYAQALAQLEAMGFSNAEVCRRALEAAGGDISMALNFLTGGL